MLILAIISLGMIIGWVAQIIVGRGRTPVDWGRALLFGIVGSFVGGLIASLIAGDGLKLRASGIIGSLVGAIILTAIFGATSKSKQAAATSSGSRSKARR
jgi:uncharacterized membrane protein YeaQ/YmgE (transglycosylase-associated protein family)